MTRTSSLLLLALVALLLAGAAIGSSAAVVDGPRADTCSVDQGCPMSAMAYATGSLLEPGAFSESALQVGTNISLHLHLCCGYKFRGSLLAAGGDVYRRFLAEMLHVSPLAHLSSTVLERIFPHADMFFTDIASGARRGPGLYATSSTADPPDGDILTLVMRPQGPEFSLKRPTAYRPPQRDGNVPHSLTAGGGHAPFIGGGGALARPDDVGAVGTLYDSGRHGHDDEGLPDVETQLFVPNFAIQCKCPHTLRVLPMLRFAVDRLEQPRIDGAGPQCITAAAVEPVAPWSQLIGAATRPYSGTNPNVAATSPRAHPAASKATLAEATGVDGYTLGRLIMRDDNVVARRSFRVSVGDASAVPLYSIVRWRFFEAPKDGAGASLAAVTVDVGPDGIAAGLRLAAEERVVVTDTPLAEKAALSPAFELRPNTRYVVTVTIRKGQVARVAHAPFILRVPLWLAHPAAFLALNETHANGVPKMRPAQHNRALIGRRMALTFAAPIAAPDIAGHYRRAWATTVSLKAHRERCQKCLERFMSIHRRRDAQLSRESEASGGSDSPISVGEYDDANHYNDLGVLLRSTGAFHAAQLRKRRALEEKLVAQADARYRDALQDAECHDVFEHLDRQRRHGQDLHIPADFLGGGSQDQLVPWQQRLAQAPSALGPTVVFGEPLFRPETSLEGPHSRRDVITLHHTPDGATYYFAIGHTALEAWMVDIDGVCNATVTEGVDVYAVYPDIARPLRSGHPSQADIVRRPTNPFPEGSNPSAPFRADTSCTLKVALQALAATEAALTTIGAVFPPLQGTTTGAKLLWTCFNESHVGRGQHMPYPATTIEEQRSVDSALHTEAERSGGAAPVVVPVDAPSSLSASTNFTPMMTGRCFWSLSMPVVPSGLPWLTIDADHSAVTREAGYFDKSRDLLLADNVTVRCRATSLPLEVLIHVDTKQREFNIDGLLPGGAWAVAHPLALVFADPTRPTATFRLEDNDVFDVAHADEVQRVPLQQRRFVLKRNATDGSAAVLLPLSTAVYTLRHDETGLCPPSTTVVHVVLVQTPPAPVAPAAAEHFLDRSFAVVEVPRTPSSDECIDVSPVAAHGLALPFLYAADELKAITEGRVDDFRGGDAVTSNGGGWFGGGGSEPTGAHALTLRARVDARKSLDAACKRALTISVHETTEGAERGLDGVVVWTADGGAARCERTAAHRRWRFVRVAGLTEGTTCTVEWSARNAAGSTSRQDVLHTCRLPPTLALYHTVPRILASSSAASGSVYDSSDRLRSAWPLRSGVSLFPVAGDVLTLHYRLTDSSARVIPEGVVLQRADDVAAMAAIHFAADASTHFPFAHNVTPVAGSDGVTIFRYLNATLRAGPVAALTPQQRTQSALVFGPGQLALETDLALDQDRPRQSLAASGLGPSTQTMLSAEVVVEEGVVRTSAIPRVHDVFSARRMCRSRHRAFAIFSLEPLATLHHVLQQAPGDEYPTLTVCTEAFRYVLRPALGTVLGFDATWECAGEMAVSKVSATESVLTPKVLGQSQDFCKLTLRNSFTKTADVATIKVVSVQPTNRSRYAIYALDTAADVIATRSPPEAAKRLDPPQRGKAAARGVRRARLVVGKEFSVVIHAADAHRLRGAWSVRAGIAHGTLRNAQGNITSTANLHEGVRIEEHPPSQQAAVNCTASCISARVSQIPTTGVYTLAYTVADPRHGSACPMLDVVDVFDVLRAEVTRPEIVTCLPHAALSAVAVPLRFAALGYYGRWSIVSYHTRPAETLPNPEGIVRFDNISRANTTVRGLRFGWAKLRWGLYSRSDILVDSTVVNVYVPADTLPSDRLVTFRAETFIHATGSTVDWRVTKAPMRDVALRFEPLRLSVSEDPVGAVTGRLHILGIPFGTVTLQYEPKESLHVHTTFPAIALRQCPKDAHGAFFVERVAASIAATTNMRVECQAYSGTGTIALRLDTSGTDEIRFANVHNFRELIFDGAEALRRARPRCTVPWWVDRRRVTWSNVSFHHKNRGVNITLRATEFISRAEWDRVPLFAAVGDDCYENQAFITAKVVEGVPGDRASALYIPLHDAVHMPGTSMAGPLHFIRPLTGQRAQRVFREGSLTVGNTTFEVALSHHSSFGRTQNTSMLLRCLRGALTAGELLEPWVVLPPTTHRGKAAWERLLGAVRDVPVSCAPRVYLPNTGANPRPMTIADLQKQLSVIFDRTTRSSSGGEGEMEGLSRATQIAWARRRMSIAQVRELLEFRRRQEAAAARATQEETPLQEFERVMQLARAVFGEEPAIPAIAVTLPAAESFFTTEDVHLAVRLSKAVVCGIIPPADDEGAVPPAATIVPSNRSGFGQASFGSATIEDEVPVTEVLPRNFRQCHFEKGLPVLNLAVRNGAFRSDASITTCPIELHDHGVLVSDNVSRLDTHRNPSDLAQRRPMVGLEPCFSSFLSSVSFTTDAAMQHHIAVQLAACPALQMIDLDEYNSHEPQRRTAFFHRMTRPHHLRVVLKRCVIPDKHSEASRDRHEFLDGHFDVLVHPTMAHLTIQAAAPRPADRAVDEVKRESAQLVDPTTAELDRLVVCESDMRHRGLEVGVELRGDRWHQSVGAPHRGSYEAAMLNAFSVVEREEYLLLNEDRFAHRDRITRLVDRRFGTFTGDGETDGHASSAGTGHGNVRASRFLRYLYRQMAAARVVGTHGPSVHRHNDTYIRIHLPSDQAHGAESVVGLGATAAGAASQHWGFGGAIEEVRVAVPGVATECRACLLADMNFFFAGDMAGSISFFSQRTVSRRLMAERAQTDAKLRLALVQLAEDAPVVVYHHWLCPHTAAARLRDIRKSLTNIYSDGGGIEMEVPTVELILEVPLGEDADALDESTRQAEAAAADHFDAEGAPSSLALDRTHLVVRPTSDGRNATMIAMHSALASVEAKRVESEAEVAVLFSTASMSHLHRLLSLAMKHRKARVGYGAGPEDLAFTGTVTARTCVASHCRETAARSVVVGPWEKEVAPVVHATLGAQRDRSYIAEGQRSIRRVAHSVRSRLAAFLMYCLHHLGSALLTTLLFRPAQHVARAIAPAPRGGYGGGFSPLPTARTPGGLVGGRLGGAQRSPSIQVRDLDVRFALLVGISAFVVFSTLGALSHVLWAAAFLTLWAAALARSATAEMLAGFVLHCLIYVVIAKQ